MYIGLMPDGTYKNYSGGNIVATQFGNFDYSHLSDLCDLGAYLIKGYTVYQCRWSAQGKPVVRKVYVKPLKIAPFTTRGAIKITDAAGANKLIGHKIFRES